MTFLCIACFDADDDDDDDGDDDRVLCCNC